MTFSPTPMMAQWRACKEEARDALLLFRLGDFYEAFEEDANKVATLLGIVLTQRQGTPMCGVPVHSLDVSIDKLIAQGFKVAIAEQMEEPVPGKGLVKRAVSRIITPGTVMQSELIQPTLNRYIASLMQISSLFGLAVLDVTTGEFVAMEWDQEQPLLEELHRLRPAELLVTRTFQSSRPQFLSQLSLNFSFLLNEREEWQFHPESALNVLLNHFHLSSLDSTNLAGRMAAWSAAGALLLYLKEDLRMPLLHVTRITVPGVQQHMLLDRATFKNLELDSLRTFLDRTATAMGARLLRHWLAQPQLSLVEIQERQEVIAHFLAVTEKMQLLHQFLRGVRDLERLMARLSLRTASPRDVLALGVSLKQIPAILAQLQEMKLSQMVSPFTLGSLATEITAALREQLPLRTSEGGLFKEGMYPELDQLRALKTEAVDWIARYQSILREQTGIKTLKVGYTRAFGYYIEVGRGKGEHVPAHFQRRQTLVNGERFVTEELKRHESEVLLAEERLQALEEQFFEQLRQKCIEHLEEVLFLAKQLARVDVLLALALVAQEQKLVRPVLDEGDQIVIRNGRHPVLENVLGRSRFIANDIHLHSEKQLLLLTGPNMGGKSTYIRQVALIVILAQMGSYIPADFAQIGVVDKLFSRIGASDDLARGHSTFMVEMSETAYILNNVTPRSLVLLDELGRGTSTYDGIAIAWAVSEFLLKKRVKTLFATHYWELTQLDQQCERVFNMHVAIQETGGAVLFLHRILPGPANRSYGVHVAKLAGMPPIVVHRAEQLLKTLEKQKKEKKNCSEEQFSFL
jgi:DNA mismatch repair protein MutS